MSVKARTACYRNQVIVTCCEQPLSLSLSLTPPFSRGHFDQICALTSLTAAPDAWPLHLKFPRLCKSLCRLMPQFMQIQFLPLRLEALKGRWALTFPTNSYVSSQRLSHNCWTRCCFCGRQRDGEQFQNSKRSIFTFFFFFLTRLSFCQNIIWEA